MTVAYLRVSPHLGFPRTGSRIRVEEVVGRPPWTRLGKGRVSEVKVSTLYDSTPIREIPGDFEDSKYSLSEVNVV